MVGFDSGKEQERMLNGLTVVEINPDLTTNSNITQVSQLTENAGICFMGPSPKGPFDISYALAQELIKLPNINGKSNAEIVKPVASAIDLVQNSREKWTIDFNTMGMEEASEYEGPFEYIKNHVYPIRSQNRRQAYAEKWWQYAEPRPGMRRALRGKQRFIATPGVAKHRIFVWMPSTTLCNQGTLVFARDDDYFLGVLHSRPHELWSRRAGTQLREAESGFRYTPTTTFETFPFPWAPGQEATDDPKVQAIAEAARELVQKRDNWLNPAGASAEELKKRTLTNLYNQRPTWLDNAHKRLDKAVFAAYGWSDNLSDEEILENLLTLNLMRATSTMPDSNVAEEA